MRDWQAAGVWDGLHRELLRRLRLPAAVPRPRGGRPRVPDRAALTGILFVLRTGIQWEMLPLEMG